jgi:hypothetical protein
LEPANRACGSEAFALRRALFSASRFLAFSRWASSAARYSALIASHSVGVRLPSRINFSV